MEGVEDSRNARVEGFPPDREDRRQPPTWLQDGTRTKRNVSLVLYRTLRCSDKCFLGDVDDWWVVVDEEAETSWREKVEKLGWGEGKIERRVKWKETVFCFVCWDSNSVAPSVCASP
jgi:hypothetical protein